MRGLHRAHNYRSFQADGTPRKLMDSSLIHTLGWKSKIGLREGIAATIATLASGNFFARS